MDAGPQRRLLTRRSAAPVSAADHGPGIWLRGGQRRSPDPRPVLAAQLDETHACGAQDQPGVRARQADIPPSRQPQGARVFARARRRSHPVRGEPRPLGAARRARPRALSRTGASRAAGPHAFPADRRAPVHADAARAQLLLVPSRDRRAGAQVARGAPDTGRPAHPHPLRRLDELLPRPRRALAHRHGGKNTGAARGAGAAPVPAIAALVRGQGRSDQRRAPDRSPLVGNPGRQMDVRAVQHRGQRRAGDLLHTARARVGRHR